MSTLSKVEALLGSCAGVPRISTGIEPSRTVGEAPEYTTDTRSGRTESFLVDFVRTHPALRHGAIIRAAQDSCGVSRATASRHLTRLVRFGDLTLLPDRTYVSGDSGAPPGMATMEVRWQERSVIVLPDGSVRIFSQREFRVISGEISFLAFPLSKPPSRFAWWSPVPARLSKVSPKAASGGHLTYYFTLERPFNAKSPAWNFFPLYFDVPRWYRMGQARRFRSRAGPAASDVSSEFESIEVLSEAPLFRQRFSPDAHLRLLVALPHGFPAGRVGLRVRLRSDPYACDRVEESRLARLSEVESTQEGLRRVGEVLTLTVPQPLLDRHYELFWELPTDEQRAQWMKGSVRSYGT